MSVEKSFGSFINEKRLEKKITLRGFAKLLDISPVYVCSMEKDRKPAPRDDILERMAKVLLLSSEETIEMYDLAASSKIRPEVSIDLPDYIMENDIVRIALRTAKDVDATDEEWQTFIDKLSKRKRPKRNGDE